MSTTIKDKNDSVKKSKKVEKTVDTVVKKATVKKEKASTTAKSIKKDKPVKKEKSAKTGKAVENKKNIIKDKPATKKKEEVKSKTSVKKTVADKTTSKKASTAKTKSVKNTTSVKKSTKTKIKLEFIQNEFYEFPNNYNNTAIHLLAQTPKILFVYWELSEEYVKNLLMQYGNDFFDNTRPVLIVYNLTNNSNFEIEINSFAHNWYLSVPDSSCKFVIELGRRFYNNYNNFVSIAKSNELISPNDHILSETLKNNMEFINIKTGEKFYKHFDSSNKIYNIYDYYKQQYEDELIGNPSSK